MSRHIIEHNHLGDAAEELEGPAVGPDEGSEILGRGQPEWVVDLDRNGWQLSAGILKREREREKQAEAKAAKAELAGARATRATGAAASRGQLGETRSAWGVAFAFYGNGAGAGDTGRCRLRRDTDGTYAPFVGIPDIGQGSTTSLAQIACQELSIPMESLKKVTADTETTPRPARRPRRGSRSSSDRPSTKRAGK